MERAKEESQDPTAFDQSNWEGQHSGCGKRILAAQVHVKFSDISFMVQTNSHPYNICFNFFIVCILSQPLNTQDELEDEEPPVDDALNFLIKFATMMDEEKLWPPEEEQVTSSGASSCKSTSATPAPVSSPYVEGSKPKAGPPMHIPVVAQIPQPMMSTCKASPPTQFASVASPSGFAQGMPMPVENLYQSKKLVCTPQEMKKFLYGTTPQEQADQDYVGDSDCKVTMNLHVQCTHVYFCDICNLGFMVNCLIIDIMV